MERLDLSPDELLSTTRAVRKRLDLERPVPMELIRECMELALQAPTGSNAQGWHFVFVTDAEKRQRIGELYEKAFAGYREQSYSAHAIADGLSGDARRTQDRVVSSAEYLARNLARVPVHLIPCIEGRVDQITGPMASLACGAVYASIIPAAWSFMLAARSRGLGTVWTSLHLSYEQEIAELLGIPYEQILQVGLIPVAWSIGTDFKPAPRRDPDRSLHVDSW